MASVRDLGQSLQGPAVLSPSGGHDEEAMADTVVPFKLAAGEEHARQVNPIFAQMEPPWAHDRFFLVDLLVLLGLSIVTGVGSYGYSFIVGECLNKWLSYFGDIEYPDAYMANEHRLGCWLWIPLCWAGGTVVGVLKCTIGLDHFDSFLTEIRTQHCDTLPGLKTCVCCMASLLSGAALGPEAGLAAAGAGAGTFIAGLVQKLGPDWADETAADERRRLYVVGGICAAFGTIMPSPWVSLLICVECSLLKHDDEGKKLTLFGRRTLFLLGITATASYMTRYAVKPIPSMPDMYQMAEEAGEAYANRMPFEALLLGIIAAFVALVYAVIQGVFKATFTKLGCCIEGRCGKTARIIGLCSLAGLITGLLGYLVPLSLTAGKESMIPTILHSGFVAESSKILDRLSTTTLFWIAITKTISFSAAAAGGLVGGPFFPILYIGVVVGEICARIPGIHWSVHAPTLTVPVVMAAVPSAVFPIPFTMIAIPLSYFHLGPIWCVPILTGIITSYTLIVGTGLVRKLAKT